MIPYNYAEEEVYAFIKSCCSKDEDAQFMPWNIVNDPKAPTLIPDIYLPNGCQKLDIKPKTCIEVKANLYCDTLDRLREMYDIMHGHPNFNGFHLMLVTTEKVDSSQASYQELSDRDIDVVYFNDWLDKFQKLI